MKRIIYIALAVILAFSLCSCSKTASVAGSANVMTVNGEKISKGEFLVYLYQQKTTFEETGGEDIWDTEFDGMPAEEKAKENAYNTIVSVKTANANAKERGLSLDATDKKSAENQAEETYNTLGEEFCENNGIEYDTIISVMEENILFVKVMDSIKRTYQLSDAEYSAYIDKYIAENPDNSSPRSLLESALRADYIEARKQEICSDEIKKWCDEAVVEKNEDAWSSITLDIFKEN